MAKKSFIFPIQLYNIKAVRRVRTHFGISARQLSSGIGKSINYIGTIENEQGEGSYSDDVLSDIANYINKIIAEDTTLELETEGKNHYTIYDFYPKEILGNAKILKNIDPIPLGSGPTVTLNALIESTDFFIDARTLKEIVRECNKIQNRDWTPQDFTQPLENAVKRKLLKVIINDGLNTYIFTKKPKKV